MPTHIIDLGDILGEDKQVRLRKRGPVFTLPPDLPIATYLTITSAASEDGISEDQMVNRLHGEVLKLFQYGDPKMTELPEGMTLAQLVTVIARVYGDEQAAEPERPTRATSGGRSSRRSNGTKSR